MAPSAFRRSEAVLAGLRHSTYREAMIALALALVVVATPPACRPGYLAAEARLHGAAGSVAGTLRVTNIGLRACRLPVRPTVRLSWDGTTLAVRRVQLAAQPAPLRALKPGAVASAALIWRNWCGELPARIRPRLLVTLGKLPGTLRVELSDPVTAPRCTSRYEPSTLSVGRFVAAR